MKRLWCILFLVAVAVFIGCGDGPDRSREKDGPAARRGRGKKGAASPFKIGFMPKLVGIPYFTACRRGAEEAAEELGITLVYDGPTRADVNQQIGLLNHWVASGEYDCIAVACNDPKRITKVLRRAQKKGILVITFDADAQEGRSYFVNQATYDSVAESMVDAMAEELTPRGVGKVGILTSSIQAPNQSEWARRMKAYARKRYPRMELLPEEEHGEDRNPGIAKAKAMIKAHEDLKGIIGLTSVAVPAAAEAVRQLERQGEIKVTGVSTPRDMRDYVKDGTVKTVILWNPVDLGYLTVHVANLVRGGDMPKDGLIKKVGRLRNIQVRGQDVILGKPMRFTRDNIDQFDF
jgi:ABC-type sugar transport system substrate-binding protein